jgi:CBS domain-containing protein
MVNKWICRPEPQQLLEFTVFLDFRPVYGEAELAKSLHRHVQESLQESTSFLPFLARDLMRFRPPATGLGRRIQWWDATVNLLDLKAIMMPLSGMARLYALHNSLDETHTLDRLEALTHRAIFTAGNLREITATYELLLRLRLHHQAECLRESRPLDNIIDWRLLTRSEQTQIDQSIKRIAAIQKKISYDFLGGT